MQLVILHYHFRTGGVRRVIELGTAAMSSALGSSLSGVVLVGGEAPPSTWLRSFREQIRPTQVHHHIDSSLGYLAEQAAPLHLIRSRLRSYFDMLAGRIDVSNSLIWAHNLGLGRNVPLAHELTQFCERTNVRLLLHHHDWWFDHRWSRWSEMKRGGYRSIQEVAKTLLPNKPFIRHATINHRDFSILRRHFRERVGWLPNPSSPGSTPSPARQRKATRWIQKSLNILIDTNLFDWSLEQARQEEHFKKWRAALPKQVQNLVHSPTWLSRPSAPSSLAFSRLTLEAQIEVLSQPVDQSWRRCAPLNPFLSKWRRRAAEGRLQSPPWPNQAGRWLSGAAYAKRLLRLAEKDSPPAAPVRVPQPKRVADPIESHRCQNEFIRAASRPESMFPLLWTR